MLAGHKAAKHILHLKNNLNKLKMLINTSIILVRPQMGENIGAAARAMKNFDIAELRIVAPRDGWPNEKAEAMSVGARDIIDNVKIFDNLEDAIEDVNYLAATTGRNRDMNKAVLTPESFVSDIFGSAHNNQNNSVNSINIGVMFGNEANGLSNEEVSYANSIISVPISENYPSLNLAQAICLICYEIYKSKLNQVVDDDILSKTLNGKGLGEGQGAPTSNKRDVISSGEGERVNNSHRGVITEDVCERKDLNELIKFLEKKMEEKNFYSVPEKKKAMQINVRNMFTRHNFTKQEIKTLRGILKD